MEKVVQVKLSIPLDDEGELEKEFWVDVTLYHDENGNPAASFQYPEELVGVLKAGRTKVVWGKQGPEFLIKLIEGPRLEALKQRWRAEALAMKTLQ